MPTMHIKDILENKTIGTSKEVSERHEIIGKFTKRINQDRKEDGYKDLNPAFVNKKMRTLSVQGLHMLYGSLEDSPKFDASWWVAVGKLSVFDK